MDGPTGFMRRASVKFAYFNGFLLDLISPANCIGEKVDYVTCTFGRGMITKSTSTETVEELRSGWEENRSAARLQRVRQKGTGVHSVLYQGSS